MRILGFIIAAIKGIEGDRSRAAQQRGNGPPTESPAGAKREMRNTPEPAVRWPPFCGAGRAARPSRVKGEEWCAPMGEALGGWYRGTTVLFRPGLF